ncbi:MAG: transglutaminase-like domain-containing protein [Planctomycetota bacterium]|jgi:hypothetical protein
MKNSKRNVPVRWLMDKGILKLFLVIVFIFGVSSCTTLRTANEIQIPKQDVPQEYFSFLVNGKKFGYSTESRFVESDKVITITNEFTKLHRVGVTVKTVEYTKHVERPDGEPIAFEHIEKTDSKFWFFHDRKSKRIEGVKKEDGDFEVTKTSNGKTKHYEIKCPDGLLLSEGVRLLIKETDLKEGEKFSVKEISGYDPFEIVDEAGEIGQTKDISLLHNTMPLTEIFITANSTLYGQIPMVAYVDKDFNTKKNVATIGGLTLESISCSREFALSKTEKVYLTSMAVIQCPVRLNNPEKAKRIRYHLIPINNIELEIPSSDNQSVQKSEDGSIFVTVHPAKAADGISFPYTGTDKATQEALKPTEILQCDDEKIIALARKAVGKTKDAAKAARKIEAFVNNYMRLSGSFTFASAVEVANERKGDCTEYAVLTAAMCRASGIPAKLVSGYVYCDYFNGKWHVFVPHEWTEVYIGDKWIGLEATKNRFFGIFNSFTAGHIALSGTDDKAALSGLKAIAAFKIRQVEQY